MTQEVRAVGTGLRDTERQSSPLRARELGLRPLAPETCCCWAMCGEGGEDINSMAAALGTHALGALGSGHRKPRGEQQVLGAGSSAVVRGEGDAEDCVWMDTASVCCF